MWPTEILQNVSVVINSFVMTNAACLETVDCGPKEDRSFRFFFFFRNHFNEKESLNSFSLNVSNDIIFCHQMLSYLKYITTAYQIFKGLMYS